MIDGHGDDLHLHGNISMNFSSNIFAHADIRPRLPTTAMSTPTRWW